METVNLYGPYAVGIAAVLAVVGGEVYKRVKSKAPPKPVSPPSNVNSRVAHWTALRADPVIQADADAVTALDGPVRAALVKWEGPSGE